MRVWGAHCVKEIAPQAGVKEGSFSSLPESWNDTPGTLQTPLLNTQDHPDLAGVRRVLARVDMALPVHPQQ